MSSSMLLLLAKFTHSVTFTHCQLWVAGSLLCVREGYTGVMDIYHLPLPAGTLSFLVLFWLCEINPFILSSSFRLNFPMGKHQQEAWRIRVRSLYFLSELPPCHVGTGWLLLLNKYDSQVILAKQPSFWYRWLLTCFCTFSSEIQRHPCCFS